MPSIAKSLSINFILDVGDDFGYISQNLDGAKIRRCLVFGNREKLNFSGRGLAVAWLFLS